MKAAVLQGDPEVPDLLAVSYYYQKLVHFLSTISEKINWVQCEKKVFCVESDQVETLKFLRLSINNDYNYGMGVSTLLTNCDTIIASINGSESVSGGSQSSSGQLGCSWLIVMWLTRLVWHKKTQSNQPL